MELKPLKIGNLTARLPVIQGGMGVGVSLSGLAGAVAAEGGIGIISTAQIGFRESDFDCNPIAANLRAVGKEIKKAKELAKGGIIGVNIMTVTRGYEDYVRAAIDAGAQLIVSGAGLPMSLPAIAQKAAVKLAPIVSSVKSASVICKYWLKKYSRLPDLVVVEGPLAGGHLGFTREQLQDVEALNFDEEVKNIITCVREFGSQQGKEIPVVVAGGVYDREDCERYMEMGADGVQLATRFVTTCECDASDAYKQSYIHARKEDIVLVDSPVGMPGRAIRNAFLERVKQERYPHESCHVCIVTCKPAETPYCITDALIRAVEGDVENGLLFCGTNAWRAERLVHVSEIMDEFR